MCSAIGVVVATIVVLFFRDNGDDIRYDLAGKRGGQRAGEGGCQASARGMLRP